MMLTIPRRPVPGIFCGKCLVEVHESHNTRPEPNKYDKEHEKDERAVQWVCKDDETDDDIQDTQEYLPCPLAFINRSTGESEDSPYKPECSKKRDNENGRNRRRSEEHDTDKKGEYTPQEYYPPG